MRIRHAMQIAAAVGAVWIADDARASAEKFICLDDGVTCIGTKPLGFGVYNVRHGNHPGLLRLSCEEKTFTVQMDGEDAITAPVNFSVHSLASFLYGKTCGAQS